MSEYVFCPRCGAVTKPGVCTNCGYTINTEENENIEDGRENQQTYETLYTGPARKQPEPNTNKSSKGWIIGVVIGLAVIVAIILLLVLLFVLAFVPLIIKGAYNVTQTPTVTTAPPNNPVTNIFPDIDPDVDPDTDPDVDPDVDPDGLPDVYDPASDEYYYAKTIEPLYSGTSNFDYDKFVNEIVPSANEYWDESSEDTFDYYINGSYTSYLKSFVSHDFIERDGFPTPYYEYLIDSYIENDKYEVERRIIRYEGECNGLFINAYCAYYSLSSDDVDFTEANEALRNQAISELYEYISKKSAGNSSSETFNYTLYTDAVITFNNDEIISVGYSTTSYENNNIENFYIHGVNVYVKNGKVIDNKAVLNLNDDFSEFFVKRSNIQNSYVDAINNSPFSDTTKVFNDDDALILLFTPLGVEVGINYRYQYSYGWVTITINDYDKYFMHQYNFDTGYGKQYYDMYKYEKENGIYDDPYSVQDGDDGNVFDL